MTTDCPISLTPFILRFAEQLPHVVPQKIRYDEVRQITQVYHNNKWIDSPDALNCLTHSTRITRVEAETTDDE